MARVLRAQEQVCKQTKKEKARLPIAAAKGVVAVTANTESSHPLLLLFIFLSVFFFLMLVRGEESK